MNGFTMMSDSYKSLVKQGKITQEEANPEIRIFDFLATCSEDDFCRLVDSGAFNDIIRAFADIAIANGNSIGLFEMTAKEALAEQKRLNERE